MCGILDPVLALLVQGPLVSVLVQALKRVPWVAAHAKLVAALLNLAAVALAGVVVCSADLGQVAAAWLAAFSGSVATYETALKPLGGGGKGDNGEGPNPDDHTATTLRGRF